MFYLFTGEGLGWVGNTVFWKSSACVGATLKSNLILLLQKVFGYCDFHLPWRKKCIQGDLEELNHQHFEAPHLAVLRFMTGSMKTVNCNFLLPKIQVSYGQFLHF